MEGVGPEGKVGAIQTRGCTEQGEDMPEVTFGLFVSGLMMEALIALGDVENPVTKKKEKNIAHAKFIIDTLSMLKDKTRSNLDKAEEGALSAVLYDLQMRFVTMSGGSKNA